MLPQLRDTLVYNATASTGSFYAIDFNGAGHGGLINVNDWGIALLVWSANGGSALTGLQSNWTILIPPTRANQICFAVVVGQFTSTDMSTGTPAVPPVPGEPGTPGTPGTAAVPAGTKRLTVTLGNGMHFLAVTTWYSGVSRVDAVGPLGVNPNAVMTTSVAPSMIASGRTDELILAAFATDVRAGHGQMTLDRGTVRVDGVGTANTVRGFIADLPAVGLGPTGDVTATYDFGLSSRAGVQIGLLPLTPALGGVPKFRPTVTLKAAGIPISFGTAQFGLTVTLAAPNPLLGSRAQFSPTVALGIRSHSINHVGFRATVTLTARGAPLAPAAFRLTVRLATHGRFTGKGTVAFAPTVTLTASGHKRASAAITLGPSVGLSVHGIPVKNGRPHFGPDVRLSIVGRPTALAVPAGFGPTVRLFIQSPVVRVSGRPQFGFVLRLRAQSSLVALSATAHFTPQVELTVVGTPHLTPVGQAQFTPAVVLAVDGFTRPAHPVGITVKPVTVEPDSDWHGRPKDEISWSTE